MAEYSRRPLPQIEIRKNMGISSSSQKTKKSRKSSEVNTPTTAPWSASSHTKYLAHPVLDAPGGEHGNHAEQPGEQHQWRAKSIDG